MNSRKAQQSRNGNNAAAVILRKMFTLLLVTNLFMRSTRLILKLFLIVLWQESKNQEEVQEKLKGFL
jgi:hypothetical protein